MRILSAGVPGGMATLAAVLVATGWTHGAPRPRGVAASVSGQVAIHERPGDGTEDLGNVVVYLEPAGAPTRANRLAPVKTVMALQSRQFSPRVRVITEGSKIEFPNQDPFSHNVFSKLNGGFDTGVYGRGKTRDQTFKEPGVYPIYCNVHPRMTAFVIALKTPYFTQAGADGRFVLDDVSPGLYTMNVWHDRASQFTRDLAVTASGVGNLKVDLDARGFKYVQHKNKLGKDYANAAGDRY